MTRVAEIRPLSSDDVQLLRRFTCRDYERPWTIEIEEMVRVHLWGVMALGKVEAIGAFLDQTLVGVAAWTWDADDQSIGRCVLLAVQRGFQRRGIARELKEQLLGELYLQGASAVVSFVHEDNEPMIRLNRGLGGTFARDGEYLVCTITP